MRISYPYFCKSTSKIETISSAFGKLGVWRDLNHNGISEEGEIFALKDLRIKSLNLGYTQADKDLGNGNTLVIPRAIFASKTRHKCELQKL